MYYIYHIPTFLHKDGAIGKIGCSVEPERRVNTQGYTEYEILEEHTDIDIASQREIELQKQYGYKVDLTLYSQSYDWCNKGHSNGGLATGQKLAESGEWEKRRQNGVKKAAELSRKPILVFHYPSGEFHSEWPGIKPCADGMGLDRTSIIRMLQKSIGNYKGSRPLNHHHYYTFQYKNPQ